MRKSFVLLDKGLDILSLFDISHQELSARQVSELFQIPLSSTYKHIDLLFKKSFLNNGLNRKRFFLGLRIFKMGNIVSTRVGLADIAAPHMKRLSQLSRETVLLPILKDWEAVCIDKIKTNGRIKLSLEREAGLPLHAGASSKILLAYQEDSFVDAMVNNVGLAKLTENTITNPDRLKNELRETREQGYAFSDLEADLMTRAIAGPIFDHKGKLVSGLSVEGPAERFNDESTPKLIALVRECAQRISHDFGYEKSD